MTTIKTTCEYCGDVELVPDDLALELDPGQDQGKYRFECPVCARVQRRPANSRVVSILLATGVTWRVVGSPITEREIQEFSRELEREDWMRYLPTP
ncbi:MAG: hypothetical protein M3N51_07365 [Actinomycetota bacterium]|nr:hypothetical protein [Actinomycetota bacterium]